MRRFSWWRDSDNRDGATAIVGILKAVFPAAIIFLVAIAGWFGLDLATEKPSAAREPSIQTGDNSPVQTGSGTQINLGDNGQVIMTDPDKVADAAPAEPVVTMTLAQFEERQLFLKQQITASLGEAHADDRARLEQELAEVTRRLADLPAAYEEARARIAELETRLAQLAGDVPDAQLQAAKDALALGDTSKADALFAGVEENEALAIGRAAEAAYARGKIAEDDVRWADAAAHYDKAAQLDPRFETLVLAGKLLWMSGQIDKAIAREEEVVALTGKKQGSKDPRLAPALNNLAKSYASVGRYEEAEPLFREALEIARNTIGTEHADYAIGLSNLADLLRATGRVEEAEPLYREALEITRVTRGPGHPDFALDLNNLAVLLETTDRFEEAETLYREALEIDRRTIGTEHPEYSIHLNNLAGLLRATGRYEEAEPLYRESLAISRKTLGAEHPDYAIHLNNFAGLLRITGRVDEAGPLYREALAILETQLGADHPNTRIARRNLDRFLAGRRD